MRGTRAKLLRKKTLEICPDTTNYISIHEGTIHCADKSFRRKYRLIKKLFRKGGQ